MDIKKIVNGAILGALILVALFFIERHREIGKIHSALRAAQSWQVDIDYSVNSRAGQAKFEVVCPDRMRMEGSGLDYARVMRIGDQYWAETGFGSSAWTPMPDTHSIPNPCQMGTDQPILHLNPMAKAAAIAAEFDRAIRDGASFSKGDRDPSGCRKWEVDNYTLCVDEVTNLPVRLDQVGPRAEMHARFSRWNEAIDISPPQ